MGRVALIGENSIGYVNALLDIWNSGDCAVLLDWRIPFPTLIEMMGEADVYNCFIEKGLYDKIENKCINSIKFTIYEKLNNSAQFLPSYIYDKFQERYSRTEAVVIYSSGTTGKSKGIILSHFAINTNADSILDYMQLNASDSIYIAKPLFHSSTITGELMVALKTKTPLIIAPTLVPPRYVFKNIDKYNITTICLNPTLLRLYTHYWDANKLNTQCLKTIYVSGSILNLKLLQKSRDTFKGIAIYNVYGLSEAGPRVCAQRADCYHNNSVGKPIKGVDIVVINEQNEIAKINEYGIIHISSPSLFSNYISGNIKHISLYRDWLNSGDIGYIDDLGELNIVGRVDDVIIIDSHKIYPNDIENIILKLADVDECVVVKIDNSETPCLGCLYTGKDDKIIIRCKLNDILLPYEIPKIFLKCETLPRNSNGKISVEKVFRVSVRYQ